MAEYNRERKRIISSAWIKRNTHIYFRLIFVDLLHITPTCYLPANPELERIMWSSVARLSRFVQINDDKNKNK